MKKIACLLALLGFPSFASAFDGIPQPRMLAYWQLLTDASGSGAKASFGVRFNSQVQETNDIRQRHSAEPPLIDLKFTREGFTGFYVRGANLTPRRVVLNADGEPVAATQVNWLVVGVVAAGAVVAVAATQSKSSTPTPHPPQPGPPVPCPPPIPGTCIPALGERPQSTGGWPYGRVM